MSVSLTFIPTLIGPGETFTIQAHATDGNGDPSTGITFQLNNATNGSVFYEYLTEGNPGFYNSSIITASSTLSRVKVFVINNEGQIPEDEKDVPYVLPTTISLFSSESSTNDYSVGITFTSKVSDQFTDLPGDRTMKYPGLGVSISDGGNTFAMNYNDNGEYSYYVRNPRGYNDTGNRTYVASENFSIIPITSSSITVGWAEPPAVTTISLFVETLPTNYESSVTFGVTLGAADGLIYDFPISQLFLNESFTPFTEVMTKIGPGTYSLNVQNSQQTAGVTSLYSAGSEDIASGPSNNVEFVWPAQSVATGVTLSVSKAPSYAREGVTFTATGVDGSGNLAPYNSGVSLNVDGNAYDMTNESGVHTYFLNIYEIPTPGTTLTINASSDGVTSGNLDVYWPEYYETTILANGVTNFTALLTDTVYFNALFTYPGTLIGVTGLLVELVENVSNIVGAMEEIGNGNYGYTLSNYTGGTGNMSYVPFDRTTLSGSIDVEAVVTWTEPGPAEYTIVLSHTPEPTNWNDTITYIAVVYDLEGATYTTPLNQLVLDYVVQSDGQAGFAISLITNGNDGEYSADFTGDVTTTNKTLDLFASVNGVNSNTDSVTWPQIPLLLSVNNTSPGIGGAVTFTAVLFGPTGATMSGSGITATIVGTGKITQTYTMTESNGIFTYFLEQSTDTYYSQVTNYSCVTDELSSNAVGVSWVHLEEIVGSVNEYPGITAGVTITATIFDSTGATVMVDLGDAKITDPTGVIQDLGMTLVSPGVYKKYITNPWFEPYKHQPVPFSPPNYTLYTVTDSDEYVTGLVTINWIQPVATTLSLSVDNNEPNYGGPVVFNVEVYDQLGQTGTYVGDLSFVIEDDLGNTFSYPGLTLYQAFGGDVDYWVYENSGNPTSTFDGITLTVSWPLPPFGLNASKVSINEGPYLGQFSNFSVDPNSGGATFQLQLYDPIGQISGSVVNTLRLEYPPATYQTLQSLSNGLYSTVSRTIPIPDYGVHTGSQDDPYPYTEIKITNPQDPGGGQGSYTARIYSDGFSIVDSLVNSRPLELEPVILWRVGTTLPEFSLSAMYSSGASFTRPLGDSLILNTPSGSVTLSQVGNTEVYTASTNPFVGLLGLTGIGLTNYSVYSSIEGATYEAPFSVAHYNFDVADASFTSPVQPGQVLTVGAQNILTYDPGVPEINDGNPFNLQLSWELSQAQGAFRMFNAAGSPSGSVSQQVIWGVTERSGTTFQLDRLIVPGGFIFTLGATFTAAPGAVIPMFPPNQTIGVTYADPIIDLYVNGNNPPKYYQYAPGTSLSVGATYRDGNGNIWNYPDPQLYLITNTGYTLVNAGTTANFYIPGGIVKPNSTTNAIIAYDYAGTQDIDTVAITSVLPNTRGSTATISTLRYRDNQTITSIIGTNLPFNFELIGTDNIPYNLFPGETLTLFNPSSSAQDQVLQYSGPTGIYALPGGLTVTGTRGVTYQRNIRVDEPNSSSSLPFRLNILPTTNDAPVPCFFADAPVLTPSGNVRIDSLKTGDVLVTPKGFAFVKNLRSYTVAASPHTNPYLIPCGLYGASEDLVISPLHGVQVGDKLIAAKDLGLVQQNLLGTIHYFNVELDKWDNMYVAGVEVESLAPAAWVVIAEALAKVK